MQFKAVLFKGALCINVGLLFSTWHMLALSIKKILSIYICRKVKYFGKMFQRKENLYVKEIEIKNTYIHIYIFIVILLYIQTL